MKNFSTLTDLIDFIGSNYQNKKAFNFYHNSKHQVISVAEFVDNIKSLALGLNALGVRQSDGFGIVAKPSPVWLEIDLAVIANGAISVPIFPDISPQNLLFETKDANVKFVFCDSLENLQILQNSGVEFEKIIIYGFIQEINFNDKNIIRFDDLLANGQAIYQQNPQLFTNLSNRVDEQSLATIIYTSGSTGVPKGVEITHRNLISQIKSAAQCFGLDSETDVALSFLPLAHIFERMIIYFYISQGIEIHFVDDVKNVAPMLREINPTLMTVVPRMLEKIFTKINNGVNEANFFKKTIGKIALDFLNKPNPKQSKFYKIFDFLVYKKLRLIFGNRLQMIICGGAPLSPSIEQLFYNIGINLYVGYGTTESSPVISVNYLHHHKTGTVGKAFPNVEVKLDATGELLTKGDNIMRGYHNSVEKTKETIDENGWLKTGDLAIIDDGGFIKIIGRKKEMFKTAGGKYVSPVPIEQKLMASWQILSAACVVAEGKKFVSCLLFLDFETLVKYKKKVRLENLSDEDFLNSDFVKNRTKKLIDEVNKDLNHWEQIQRYYLSNQPISINTGEITPSMKLRRNFVEEKFKDVIEKFYTKSG